MSAGKARCTYHTTRWTSLKLPTSTRRCFGVPSLWKIVLTVKNEGSHIFSFVGCKRAEVFAAELGIHHSPQAQLVLVQGTPAINTPRTDLLSSPGPISDSNTASHLPSWQVRSHCSKHVQHSLAGAPHSRERLCLLLMPMPYLRLQCHRS